MSAPSPPKPLGPIPFAETSAHAGCHVAVNMAGVAKLPPGEPFTGHPPCAAVEVDTATGERFGCDFGAGHWGKCRCGRRLP